MSEQKNSKQPDNNGQQETKMNMTTQTMRVIFNTYQDSFMRTVNNIAAVKDNVFLSTIAGSPYDITYDTEFDISDDLSTSIQAHQQLQACCNQNLPRFPKKATFEELTNFVNDMILNNDISLEDIYQIMDKISDTIQTKRQQRQKVSSAIQYSSLLLTSVSGGITLLSAFDIIQIPTALTIVCLAIVGLITLQIIVNRVINLVKSIKALTNEEKINALRQKTQEASQELNNITQHEVTKQHDRNKNKNLVVEKNENFAIQPTSQPIYKAGKPLMWMQRRGKTTDAKNNLDDFGLKGAGQSAIPLFGLPVVNTSQNKNIPSFSQQNNANNNFAIQPLLLQNSRDQQTNMKHNPFSFSPITQKQNNINANHTMPPIFNDHNHTHNEENINRNNKENQNTKENGLFNLLQQLREPKNIPQQNNINANHTMPSIFNNNQENINENNQENQNTKEDGLLGFLNNFNKIKKNEQQGNINANHHAMPPIFNNHQENEQQNTNNDNNNIEENHGCNHEHESHHDTEKSNKENNPQKSEEMYNKTLSILKSLGDMTEQCITSPDKINNILKEKNNSTNINNDSNSIDDDNDDKILDEDGTNKNLFMKQPNNNVLLSKETENEIKESKKQSNSFFN